MSFVREHFPHLAEDYARRYATADFADAVYRNRMAGIVRQLCRKHKLGERSSEALLTRHVYAAAGLPRKPQAAAVQPEQPLLFGAA
jgi:hypothetical protein